MDANGRAKPGLMAMLLPVMFCFFVMGFVDMVGVASTNLQKDLNLTETEANLYPLLAFFMFLIFSVPSGMLMNRIGRKNTVLVSLVITFIAVICPLVGNNKPVMLTAFVLLGIGNAFMQTSLNPLVSNIVSREKLASTLTFGQFVKAICSYLGPWIMIWGGHGYLISSMGWRSIFPIYAAICLLSIIALFPTKIAEEKPDKVSGFMECMKLLGSGFILLCFCGIMCHVGIDVGVNTHAPRILEEVAKKADTAAKASETQSIQAAENAIAAADAAENALAPEAPATRAGENITEKVKEGVTDAAVATTIYFLFRTIGSLSGSFILRVFSAKLFFIISVLMMLGGFGGFYVANSEMLIYVCCALLGFGNSNIFPIIFSQAILRRPKEQNEVSGLMIMGIFGGALFLGATGLAVDLSGGSQMAAVTVLVLAAIYLLIFSPNIKPVTQQQ